MISFEIYDFFMRLFMKKSALKNFAIFTGKLKVCNFFKKQTPTQVFCSEYYKIFKNTYFEEHLVGKQLLLYWLFYEVLQTVTQRCSVKKVLLEVS